MVVALIGCGNMGQAMVRGFLKNNLLAGSEIRLFDSDHDKMLDFAGQVAATACESSAEAVMGTDVVILAVKPQVIETAVSAFVHKIPENSVLVSIAAGVSLSRLRRMVQPNQALARVMPNMPAMVGSGVSAVCYDRASHLHKQQVESLLSGCGLVFPVQEKLMDAVIGLSGSGPAYVMLIIEAMADAGVREGLSRDMSIRMAAMTLLGSAKLVLDTGLHPAEIKDQVCSPGGTTIEAIKILEEQGLRAAMINAVRASAEKARQMSAQVDSHG